MTSYISGEENGKSKRTLGFCSQDPRTFSLGPGPGQGEENDLQNGHIPKDALYPRISLLG